MLQSICKNIKKNARDGAREKARKEVAAKDRIIIVEFMMEAMKKHNMVTNEGRHDFWEEVMDKYHISRKRLQKMYRQHEKDKAYLKDQKTSYRKRPKE